MERILATGRCHCGAVSFEAWVHTRSEVQYCNCSMCRMCGYQHLIVPGDCFRLMTGRNAIREYNFESRTARHFFCKFCGVKSYYVPRSNPDGFSLNVRCMVIPGDCELNFTSFDGQNWEDNAETLRHLSR